MKPAPLSFPAFRITNPDFPAVPPQTAWTERQAERKRDRLNAEHGDGFVISPAELPPEEAPAPVPVKRPAAHKRVERAPFERTEAHPFGPGDLLQCQHTGTVGEVVEVQAEPRGVFLDVAGLEYLHFLPAVNYGDYELLPDPEPQAEEPLEPAPISETIPPKSGTIPPENGTPAAESETAAPAADAPAEDPEKKKLTPKRPAVKRTAAPKKAAKPMAAKKPTPAPKGKRR